VVIFGQVIVATHGMVDDRSLAKLSAVGPTHRLLVAGAMVGAGMIAAGIGRRGR
jgi:hypothetical protein